MVSPCVNIHYWRSWKFFLRVSREFFSQERRKKNIKKSVWWFRIDAITQHDGKVSTRLRFNTENKPVNSSYCAGGGVSSCFWEDPKKKSSKLKSKLWKRLNSIWPHVWSPSSRRPPSVCRFLLLLLHFSETSGFISGDSGVSVINLRKVVRGRTAVCSGVSGDGWGRRSAPDRRELFFISSLQGLSFIPSLFKCLPGRKKIWLTAWKNVKQGKDHTV